MPDLNVRKCYSLTIGVCLFIGHEETLGDNILGSIKCENFIISYA